MKEQCNIKDSQIGVGYFLASKSMLLGVSKTGTLAYFLYSATFV